MLKSRIQSLIWSILVLFIYIFSDSYFALFLFSISLGIFLFLGISTKLIKNKMEFILNTPDTIDKNILGSCYLEVKNANFLPISKIKCTLSLKNFLTGQEEKQDIYLSVKGKSSECVYWDIKSRFCGDIEIKLDKVMYYDYFGIFTNTICPSISTHMLVLPNTFYIDINLFESQIENIESPIYSTGQKGIDSSEVFGIKEYMPGDSLKNIHWKLTSKFDDLIVKELSVTIDNSILIVLETSTFIGKGKESPKVSDAMMEAFISISKSLLENNYTHSIGFFDHKTNRFIIDEVNSMDDLSIMMRGFLEIEKRENPYSAIEYYLNMVEYKTFSHILYITSQGFEEIVEELANEHKITVLQCEEASEEEKKLSNAYGVKFTPENIEEDLRQLMI
ncbi:DUF58 domain-containing protein [Anaerosalibacter massiliensis]|uniref:DUF58 domain-containing protein n=1 Tax=Anaerosalibacter massiliensis TaxID=1347392 RepID=A0A9X2S4X7_9FIRM|nr:DUF58 domain-containing protein [Anaerosalibacter massiliensis]MCR2043948.1 DUF58 domain-containing protein [Anaerosalibacter massiliensis]